jgi:hypothetical protein
MNYGAISRFRPFVIEPLRVSPVPASIGAMSDAWDDMAAGLLSAIRTSDFTAYDTAMNKFREASTRDGSVPNKPLPVNK